MFRLHIKIISIIAQLTVWLSGYTLVSRFSRKKVLDSDTGWKHLSHWQLSLNHRRGYFVVLPVSHSIYNQKDIDVYFCIK